MNPKISVCIPAYNRANVLAELLDSILKQEFNGFEIVIAEDNSPERTEIREITNEYKDRFPQKINYFENEKNLGYDKNLRHLFELAKGDYLFFMGNDDLMATNALSTVASAVDRHPNIGVVLRTYAAFADTPDNIVETYRYFDTELFFPAGAESIATMYRRSIVIPGMVFHRESALKLSTDRFDGTLLYQLYLIAEMLVDKNAVFIPKVTVLYRTGGIPDFGNSEAEQGKFEPQSQTPESSLLFIKGMINIAKYVEQHRNIKIYKPIMRDMANYSYPLLSIQANLSVIKFIRYGLGLSAMGFGRYPMFWAYWLSLFVLGKTRVDSLINWIKLKLGRTPTLGKVYKGEVK